MIIIVGKFGLMDVLDILYNIWFIVSYFCVMENFIYKIKLFDRKKLF